MMKRKSTGEYPPEWDQVARAVKDAANWRCIRCGHRHDPETGYTLTVHHLDICPDNCAWWNCAALCQRCHLHIQGKVIMEQPYMFPHSKWFRPYVGAYYAVQSGLLVGTKDYYESLMWYPPEFIMEHYDTFLQAVRT
jgi:hypothetical protein